jgi:hypothetical protein
VAALLGQANDPHPERDEGAKPSEWLPAEWVESVLEGQSASAEVIEIQPGVRWTPRETSLAPEVAGDTAPVRSFQVPRLRLPRGPGSAWTHRRHLQAAAAAVLVLATPVLIGALNPGLTGSARPAAQSPFRPSAIAGAPAVHAPGGPRLPAAGPKPLALGGHSTGSAAVVHAAPTAGVATPASVISRTSSGQSISGSPHSSSTPPASTPQPPGSGTGNPGPTSGSTGGGGGGSSSSSSGSGSPTTSGGGGGGGGSPQGTPTQGSPPPSNPVSQLQSVVSNAPQTVQGVAKTLP